MPNVEDAIAVGTRERTPNTRHTAPCAFCGCTVHFADDTPMRAPQKACVECFLDLAEATPTTEKIQLLITPENVAILRAFLQRRVH